MKVNSRTHRQDPPSLRFGGTRADATVKRILAAMLMVSAPAGVLANDFVPGTETELAIYALENPVVVYVPDNYDSARARAWPVVFHYHGTNGQPNVGIPKIYTEGRDFVLVGMEYTVRGRPTATDDFFKAEVASLRGVQRLLAKDLNIAANRIYIGGFSKGGWISSTLAESYLPEIAGAYVLGAGKTIYRVKPLPKPRHERRLYIGVGQLEVNYPYGLMALDHFGNLGFQATFDGFPGLGHAMPLGRGRGEDPFQALSPVFLQWWEVERHRDAAAALREPVLKWFEATLALAGDAKVAPRDRFLAIYRMRRAPFYRFLNAEQRKRVTGLITTLSREPECTAEMAAQRRFFQVVDRELTAEGFAPIHQAAGDYFAIHIEFPGTYHGALAGLASLRLHDQVTDTSRWTFHSDRQRVAVETLLREKPLRKAPREALLDLIRDVELAIRQDD